MLPCGEKIIETVETADDYKTELDSIISRPLTPEIIDTYADKALGDLINLVQKTIGAYSQQCTDSFETKRDMENAAFSHYGLGDIELILDHIADRAGELNSIDEIITEVTTIDRIIVPTDRPLRPIIEGEGPSIEHNRVPRLKTLLFILANEFGVDIHDPEQVQIKNGKIDARMIREESYYSVEIPKLERTVLICDEKRNATFVFNASAMEELGISGEDLVNLTKTDLSNLLEDTPELGIKLLYSNHFVPRLVEAIENPVQMPSRHVSANSLSYLYPRAPSDILSMSGIAERLGAYGPTVASVISELGDKLGELSLYRFGNAIVVHGYTPEQQTLIEKVLGERGCFVDKAPDGILSRLGVAQELSVSDNCVSHAVKALGDELGEIRSYRFGPKNTFGFNQEQLQQIRDYLDNRGLFQDQAPDEYRSIGSIAKNLGTTHKTVSKAIDAISDQLGPTNQRRFGPQMATAFSTEQQNQIREYLENRGVMGGQATDGITSAIGLARKLGVSNGVVERAIGRLREELGEIKKCKYNKVISIGLNIEQQQTISEYLTDRGMFLQDAPEGYRSAKGISKDLGISHKAVGLAAKKLSEELGDTIIRKFHSQNVAAYSPEQQKQIIDYLRDRGTIAEKAPEGAISVWKFINELGVSSKTMKQAIKELGLELGDVKTYKFRHAVVKGYTLDQQEMIRQQVISNPASHNL